MTTTFLNLPPHLLPSSTPHLLNSAALWYLQWTKYLLTSSTPPLSGTPSGQNTSSPPQLRRSLVPPVDKIPPHLLNSVALWYPQWTKYLLTSSTPSLSGTPSGQNTSSPPQLHHSLVPQVAPTLLSGGPSGQNTSSPPQLHHSLAPQVAPTLLSGTPSGAF